METNNATAKVKTTVFHLIVLDESGSMSPLRKSAIEMCNSAILAARKQCEDYAESQHTLVSIFSFQTGFGGKSRYLVKNVKGDSVKEITEKDYSPMGGTPLYDAIGSTLIDLEAVASTHEDAHAIVTIITDGEENSSTHYTAYDIAKIIDRLKEMGWIINFVGAGIDVSGEARKMHISAECNFTIEATPDGMDNFGASYGAQMEKEAYMRNGREKNMASVEARKSMRKKMSNDFWK